MLSHQLIQIDGPRGPDIRDRIHDRADTQGGIRHGANLKVNGRPSHRPLNGDRSAYLGRKPRGGSCVSRNERADAADFWIQHQLHRRRWGGVQPVIGAAEKVLGSSNVPEHRLHRAFPWRRRKSEPDHGELSHGHGRQGTERHRDRDGRLQSPQFPAWQISVVDPQVIDIAAKGRTTATCRRSTDAQGCDIEPGVSDAGWRHVRIRPSPSVVPVHIQLDRTPRAAVDHEGNVVPGTVPKRRRCGGELGGDGDLVVTEVPRCPEAKPYEVAVDEDSVGATEAVQVPLLENDCPVCRWIRLIRAHPRAQGDHIGPQTRLVRD